MLRIGLKLSFSLPLNIIVLHSALMLSDGAGVVVLSFLIVRLVLLVALLAFSLISAELSLL